MYKRLIVYIGFIVCALAPLSAGAQKETISNVTVLQLLSQEGALGNCMALN